MKDSQEEFSHSAPMEDYESSDRPAKKRKAVYTIIDREGNSKSYWLRLGTAYVNRDESLTVYLNALPVNNRLHIRDFPDNPNY